MSAPAAPAARQRLEVPIRECARCRLWTQCGRCPDCGERLGDPPSAPNVRPGEMDFALAAAAGNWMACQVCKLAAPFHRSPDCAGIARREEATQASGVAPIIGSGD